jgi:hypothetical protein
MQVTIAQMFLSSWKKKQNAREILITDTCCKLTAKNEEPIYVPIQWYALHLVI